MGLDQWQARWRRAGKRRSAARAGKSEDDTGDPHHGAGWFTSTWDLLTGLDVREGLPEDARPEEALMAYLMEQDRGGHRGE